MDNFGNKLRQERERRKVSLDEIARLTKIRVRYLEALENGEHERLPGIVFAKGYVRAYAETIGADADQLVCAYVEEQRSLGRLQTEASQEHVLEALAAAVERDSERTSKRGRGVLIGAVALLAGAAVVWFGVRPFLAQRTATTAAATVDDDGQPVTNAPPNNEPSPTEAIVEAVEPQAAETAPVEAVEPQAVGTAPVETVRIEPPAVAPETPQPKQEANATPATSAMLAVPDYGIGTAVEQRVLVGEASEFRTSTEVAFWTRVIGGQPGSHVRHVWMYEGGVIGSIELSIGATHWRTYSKQTLRRAGNWAVEAQDNDGRVLARATFVAFDGSR